MSRPHQSRSVVSSEQSSLEGDSIASTSQPPHTSSSAGHRGSSSAGRATHLSYPPGAENAAYVSTPNGTQKRMTQSGLNHTLNTECIDIPPSDTSALANVTRFIAGIVGKLFTPHQILVILRLLKALTFCFLILTIIADLMYIYFVEIVASRDVNKALGGFRDTVLRIYGIFLCAMALILELDITKYVKHFSGLKGFIARGFLLFFIATITNTNPNFKEATQNAANNNYNYNDDSYSSEGAIPVSAIVFQIVTSWVLAFCAVTYLLLGMMCCDRFTSRAFLSSTDPVASTAIPETSNNSRYAPIDAISDFESNYERMSDRQRD